MAWNWERPPGASATRRAARKVLVSTIVGVLCLGAAWAGTGLAPVSDALKTDELKANEVPLPKAERDGNFLADAATEGAAATAFSPSDLPAGQILAGAAKVSLRPRPEDYQEQFPGARWETDQSKCEAPFPGGPAPDATHVADFRVRWAEHPDCLYMGGYSIGPVNSITSWDDEYGLWARSVAMQDRQGDAIVLTLIDAVYWEAFYSSLCPGDPCGFIPLSEQLAEETNLPAESFVFASTHSHTSMDFIGGWGGVPDWYMQQATDALKTSAKAALGSMQPAILEAGEGILRERNRERRRFYRAAEDDTLSWFRLIDADNQPAPRTCPGADPKKEESPACTPPAPGRAIATVGAYAAHPVTEDEAGGQADADFPVVFAKNVEDRFGGVGMFLQSGLGNMSPRGFDPDVPDKIEMGNGMANVIPAMGSGIRISNTDVSAGRTFWTQPVTNVPLGSLGAAGFFDRTFDQAPAAVNVGESDQPHRKCNSASPISVRTSVSAAKIGSLWITGGPGELFSNLTNTIEEQNPSGITLALGLVNDGLGYIIQSFETDHAARQGLGFVPEGDPTEYEDAYSVDHCIGDATLEHTIALLRTL